ncbi:hypothetical protein [Thalassoporum mexicanum]|uniref:hypothetical protein n=1 Tax=Thalassoporum mexicanum TaxID=3457544 RepID=UPI0003058F53|nr:hypothetical protein [Pseudanabaena sp. PCC 7367]
MARQVRSPQILLAQVIRQPVNQILDFPLVCCLSMHEYETTIVGDASRDRVEIILSF